MKWNITADRPVYLQLIEQLELAIVAGEYRAGARLPGVREMAAGAAVNPNTMQRALQELEARGLLNTQRTAGRTVTEDKTMIAQLREQLAAEQIGAFLQMMESWDTPGRRRWHFCSKRHRRNNDGSGIDMQRIDKGLWPEQSAGQFYGGFSGGRITGLLGPNGSGKTTLMKLAAGLLVPTGGSLRVCGQAPGPQTKARVAYLPERTYLSAGLRVREALELFCDFTLISAGKRRSRCWRI